MPWRELASGTRVPCGTQLYRYAPNPPFMRDLVKAMSWRKFPVSLTELCIDTTLRCGQSFRWKQSRPGTYSCALHGRLLSVRQDATHLYYRATFPAPIAASPPSSSSATPLLPQTDGVKREPASDGAPTAVKAEPGEADDDDTEAFLRHYLNLEPDLGRLYEEWAARDANFRRRAPRFAGVRVLRQDAWEALVGFICSSNNNIARISQMVRTSLAFITVPDWGRC